MPMPDPAQPDEMMAAVAEVALNVADIAFPSDVMLGAIVVVLNEDMQGNGRLRVGFMASDHPQGGPALDNILHAIVRVLGV